MILGILSCVALIFAILGVSLGIWAIIQVEAMKRSTHQLTYINPLEQNFSNMTEDTRTELAKSDDTLESIQ